MLLKCPQMDKVGEEFICSKWMNVLVNGDIALKQIISRTDVTMLNHCNAFIER
jgi:hypothetical protein